MRSEVHNAICVLKTRVRAPISSSRWRVEGFRHRHRRRIKESKLFQSWLSYSSGGELFFSGSEKPLSGSSFASPNSSFIIHFLYAHIHTHDVYGIHATLEYSVKPSSFLSLSLSPTVSTVAPFTRAKQCKIIVSVS